MRAAVPPAGTGRAETWTSPTAASKMGIFMLRLGMVLCVFGWKGSPNGRDGICSVLNLFGVHSAIGPNYRSRHPVTFVGCIIEWLPAKVQSACFAFYILTQQLSSTILICNIWSRYY